jgi:RNA polymerase sigma-70 factor (ECF subfamily)
MTTIDREQAARRAMTVALRTAAGIVSSREQAADIAQDVALDVLRSLHQLREPAAFDAWVRKIAVRHALRALKQQRAHPADVPLGLDWELADLPAADDVDRDLLIAARSALAQALTTLPARQRIALALRYVHDLNDREIAAALGCRRGTANALLSRGRATLRRSPALKDLASALEAAR